MNEGIFYFKKKIMIIGNFHSNSSTQAYLLKSIRIMIPFFNQIILISGGVPDNFKDKMIWKKTVFSEKKNNLITKIVNYFINQFLISFYIMMYYFKYKIDTILFLSSPLFPIFIAKILRIKTIRHQGGSLAKQSNLDNSKRKYDIEYFFISIIYEKIPNKLFDYILVDSIGCIEWQNLNDFKSKVFIIPFFVDIDQFFYKLDFAKRGNIIGYMGMIDKHKGIENFLDSIYLLKNYLREKTIKVNIYGDGELLNILKNKVNNHQLNDIITLFGWVEKSEVINALNNMKLLVLPSFSEGCPNIVSEARACGTPVLANAVGGIPDLIKNYETGFIMENNSPECIAKNIILALEYPDLKKISYQGRQLILNEYTYEGALKRYNLFFKTVFSSKK